MLRNLLKQIGPPGDDALVVVWNLDTGTHLQDISCPFNGPITAAVWLPSAQGSATAFSFGCADGSIHAYVQHHNQVSLICSYVTRLIFQCEQDDYTFASFTSAHGGPIEDLAFDLTHRRLASVGHGSLQVWELKPDCKQIIILVTYKDAICHRHTQATSPFD